MALSPAYVRVTWAYADDTERVTIWEGKCSSSKTRATSDGNVTNIDYAAELSGSPAQARAITNARGQPVIRAGTLPPPPNILILAISPIAHMSPIVPPESPQPSQKSLAKRPAPKQNLPTRIIVPPAPPPKPPAASKVPRPIPEIPTTNNAIIAAAISAGLPPSQTPVAPPAPAVAHAPSQAEPLSTHDEDDEPEDLEDMVHIWTGTDVPVPPCIAPAFQSGNCSLPAVAALKGGDIVHMIALPSVPIPAIASLGLVKTTRLEHLRMLRTLAALPPDLYAAPASTALTEHIMRIRNARHWRWSTTLKYLATVQGCLHLLPLYRAAPSVDLARCPVWQQTMRGAGIQARHELPQQPKPATWTQVQQTLRAEPSAAIFAAITLAWFSAARVGCILQLTKDDLQSDNSARTLSIRFRRGKAVRTRGPYTVNTTPIPPSIFARLQKYLASRRSTIFSDVKGSQVKDSLRRTDSKLEQRSLRRGSIQALAAAPGMTDATLLAFSGHLRTATLYRYLNWGVKAHHQRTTTLTQAGSALTTEPLATITFG